MSLSKDLLVAVKLPQSPNVVWGIINLIRDPSNANVSQLIIEIGKEVYISVGAEDVVPIPASLFDVAQHVIKNNANISWVLKSGMPLIVTTAGAQGLSGGALTMSGLANVGGLVGGGAFAGVVMIASVPALMSATAVWGLVDMIESDGVTKDVTKSACVVGVVGAGAMTYTALAAAIAEAGTFTGGLSLLGGGSIAAGGSGMMGGLALLGGVAFGSILAVGGVTYLGVRMYRQSVIKEKYLKKMRYWNSCGYDLPDDWDNY